MPVLKQRRTAVVVLGMHRSGTSALAGLLGDLGCALPKDPIAPAPMNPRGFSESTELTMLDDELLGALHSSWFDWTPLALDRSVAIEFSDRAQSSLESVFGDAPIFVLKDPRICRLVPFWVDVLNRADCDVRFVHLHRNPVEVTASLDRWAGYDLAYGELLWLRYVLDAESGTRGTTRAFASYESLLNDWRKFAIALAQRLEIQWPTSVEGLDSAALFVDPKLRRSLTDDQGLFAMTPWVRESFAILEKWSQHGEDPADYGTLETAKRLLDQATPGFYRVVQSGRESDIRMRRSTFGQDAEGLRKEDARERVRLQVDVRNLERELRVAFDSIKSADARRASADAEIAELQTQLQKVALQRDRLRRRDAFNMREAITDSLHSSQVHMPSENDQAVLSQRELTRLRDELATLKEENAALLTSRSWRITAPLRRIVEFVKRFSPSR